MEHTKIEGKHVLEENMTVAQKVMHRLVMRLIEISSLELIIATLHLVLFAGVVFGFIQGESGH